MNAIEKLHQLLLEKYPKNNFPNISFEIDKPFNEIQLEKSEYDSWFLDCLKKHIPEQRDLFFIVEWNDSGFHIESISLGIDKFLPSVTSEGERLDAYINETFEFICSYFDNSINQ